MVHITQLILVLILTMDDTILSSFTPTDLYGMFQIKVWTIPF